MKEKFYIGLDISTSVVGISLFNNNKELLDLRFIDLRKIKCYFSKADLVRSVFINIEKEFDICTFDVEIFIEESLQSFRRGLSSAKTLMQLARFNGVVSQISYESFKAVPFYINVNTARKSLGIKIDKNSDKSTKDQIFDWVKSRIEFDWPTKVLKSGPKKGSVKFNETCYDISDAYIICKAVLNDESIKG